MSLIFAVAALLLWLRDRARLYMLGYVVAPIAIGVSLAMNHYSPFQDDAITRITVHFFSIVACISVVWAACARLQRPVPIKSWIASALVVGVILTVAVGKDGFVASLFLVNSLCGVVFVMGAQSLSQSGSREFVDRAMVWIFALVAAQFFLRPATVVMIEGAITASEYRGSVGHALLTLSAALLTLMLASAILATILSDKFRDMQERSQSDPLTGLPLRRAFEDDVRSLLGKSDEDNTPVSLVIADIDHFKQVNDLWGHQAGDRAIANFGKLVGNTIRASDIAGRIGGEEIAVLVWNCSETQAERLAERMRKTFAALQHDGINDDVRLTASFGVTTVRRGEGYARAFSRADSALYEAKEAGRNRVVVAGAKRDRPAEPTANHREADAA